MALFAALEHRRTTGRGQQVEVPLVEPGLNLAAEQVIEYSAYGVLLGSEGNRGPDAAPQGVYTGRDGERLAIAVANDAQWRALASLFAGSHALFADAGLAAAAERHARADEIDAALARVCAEHGAAELAERLVAAGVPAQVLVNAHRVMPHPQLEHRGYYQSLEHPHTGRARYPGLPFVGLADGRPRRPPPTLGQHNREVLAGELGIAEEELARWEREGIIGTQPAWLRRKLRAASRRRAKTISEEKSHEARPESHLEARGEAARRRARSDAAPQPRARARAHEGRGEGRHRGRRRHAHRAAALRHLRHTRPTRS